MNSYLHLSWRLILWSFANSLIACSAISSQGNPTSPVKTQSPTNSPSGSNTNYGYLAYSDQSFHEDMRVAGTPVKLHYSSQRTPGNQDAYQVVVWYRDPNALDGYDAQLETVELMVTIAGRVFTHTQHIPFASATWTMQWDGYDAESNLLYGTIPVIVDSRATMLEQVNLYQYRYLLGEQTSDGAGNFPQQNLTDDLGPGITVATYTYYGGPSGVPEYYRIEGVEGLYTEDDLRSQNIIPWRTTIDKREITYVGAMPVQAGGLGGWTVDKNHLYDPQSGMFYQGDGTTRKVTPVGLPECTFDVTNTVPTEDFAVLSGDGREYYVITPQGKHLRTVDSITGTNIFTFTYTNGFLSQIIDRNSRTTTIVRATDGTAESIVGPYGLTTEVIVTNDWLSKLINPASETNLFWYNGSGLLTNVVNRRGLTYTITYDASGHAVKAEDPEGGFDSISIDRQYQNVTVQNVSSLYRTNTIFRGPDPSNGDIKEQFINSAGAVTEKRTSRDGLKVTTSYPNGMSEVIYQTPHPRFGSSIMITTQKVISTPAGLTRTTQVSLSYSMQDSTNELSQVLAVTNVTTVNGRTTRTIFDGIGRSVKWIVSSGITNIVDFDAAWHPASLTRAGFAIVTLAHDADGRIVSAAQSNRAVYLSYSTDGFLVAVTNGIGDTLYLYPDAIGRVTNIVLPDGETIGVRHQPSTPPVGVTPPGQPEHTIGYNLVGLMDRYSCPDVGSPTNMTLIWNAARQLVSVTYPDGRTITNVYDDAGFLSRTTWPENSVTNEYSCDCGQLGGVYATNGANIRFAYDGSLLTNVSIGGTITGAVNLAYNNNFQVKEIGFNGLPVNYGYDENWVLTNAGALSLQWDQYTGFMTGSVLSVIAETQTYNAFGDLETRSSAIGSTSLYSVAHAYDDAGRITQRVEGVLGSTQTWTYAYDQAERLSEVYTNGTLRARYQYDANGNRTNLTVGAATTAAQYDAQDRLLTNGTVRYQYDAHGTLTNRISGSATNAYVYDTRGSLLQVRVGTNQISYTVDPLGRRISRTKNGSTTHRFIYQGFLSPIATVNAAGDVDTRFVYATRINVPDYMVQSGITYRIITDHLGSVRLVVNADSGAIAQRIDYDEWGNVLTDTNPGFQPFGFAGGLYDPDTGLVRFGYRDYDAETGRWLAKDPILFGGGMNLYAYCYGDPINWVDPYGLASKGCGRRVISLLEGITDPAEAKDILADKFGEGSRRYKSELKIWEKSRGLRDSSVRRAGKAARTGGRIAGGVVSAIIVDWIIPPALNADEPLYIDGVPWYEHEDYYIESYPPELDDNEGGPQDGQEQGGIVNDKECD